MENNKKKPLSLYAMWLEAHKKGELPPEWRLAHNFLTWATANGYKPELGYKGKFTPANLKMAIAGATNESEQSPDAVKDLVDNNTLAALKELAKDIDIGKATKKEDIAKLIIADMEAKTTGTIKEMEAVVARHVPDDLEVAEDDSE